jgi:glucokinase
MPDELFLGIEIGGTKLQLGVGRGDGSPMFALERLDVDAARGALGILEQIDRTGAMLIARHKPVRIGIGFGGPVNSTAGRVVKSHQVAGWEDLALGTWCQQLFSLPTKLGNDCDVAALAEARFGAGRGAKSVFFITVGTGIGGGFVVEGRNYGLDRPAVAEIGHLRPGLLADSPEATVEALASGPGIAAAALARISGDVARPLDSIRVAAGFARALPVRERLASAQDRESEYIRELVDRCDGKPEQITAKIVARAADDGNPLAQEVLAHSAQALGWAIAQVVTLVAPETIVIGGGVSLIGESLFFAPLRTEVERYVFPPLRGSYRILPAALGEEVVVHGALALAKGP